MAARTRRHEGRSCHRSLDLLRRVHLGHKLGYYRLLADQGPLTPPALAGAARTNAEDIGEADRVSFELADAGSVEGAGAFDVAFAFECVHDLPDPVSFLAAMRAAAKPEGWVIVVDEAVADRFGVIGDPIERMMYGWSILG